MNIFYFVNKKKKKHFLLFIVFDTRAKANIVCVTSQQQNLTINNDNNRTV